MNTLKATPAWLRANVRPAGSGIGVDVANRRINGYVVAQEGAFLEPDPRGEFDERSLKGIVKLMREKPNGVKARWGHDQLSADSLGKFLGRAHEARLDSVTVKRDGKKVELAAVRADLHLSETAFDTPQHGDLAGYLLRLAQEDSSALASSLVLQVEEEVRLNRDGTRKTDDNGKPLPALWRPTAIHATDIVADGAAVDELLSAGVNVEGLPDAVVRQAIQMLEQQFQGAGREVVQARVQAWLSRYLDWRFPEPGILADGADLGSTCPDCGQVIKSMSVAHVGAVGAWRHDGCPDKGPLYGCQPIEDYQRRLRLLEMAG